MAVASGDIPTVLHSSRGRVRLRVPDWTDLGEHTLARRLRAVAGVESAQASALTGNVVIRFDPATTDESVLVGTLRRLIPLLRGKGIPEPAPPPALTERNGDVRRARVAVRGLDRNPSMAQRVVEEMVALSGVIRAAANPLTGRVLVEYDEHEIGLEDLIAQVSDLELPELPGEDRPAHPLDLGPLVQSSVRLAGACAGLGLLALRRAAGNQEATGVRSGAFRASAAISILQGIPLVRDGARRLLGRDRADLLFQVPGILSLTAANSPLGLMVIGAEALRLLTEVLERRRSWRRYEERAAAAPTAIPGGVVRLENGDRAPLNGRILEGVGAASGPDGLPTSLIPGAELTAGSRLFGGPFTVRLAAGEPFVPEPAAARPAPSLFLHYLRLVTPVSLGCALLAGIVTRSISRAFSTLLVVTPRPAMIGVDAADTSAAARVLRAGVTVVGTRPNRPVRRPDVLLVAAPRTVADRFEVATAHALDSEHDTERILAIAGGIAAAAGAPWGGALAGTNPPCASDGSFDGHRASGAIDGVSYSLAPLNDPSRLPLSLMVEMRGAYILVLSREAEAQPIGVIGLRARLASGVSELVETCLRHRVDVVLHEDGDLLASQGLARRAGIAAVSSEGMLATIRSRQRAGDVVACLSDSANDAEAFAAADLSIGLTSGRNGYFQARADLLAPDLYAVAAIVDAGARREAAIRDSVFLSSIANAAGAIFGPLGDVGLQRGLYSVYAATLAVLADGWLRLRGGERPLSSISRLVDPRPERWGRRSVEAVLRAFHTSPDGLSGEQAVERLRREAAPPRRNKALGVFLDQLRSPLAGILAAGATLSYLMGSTADVVVIGATLLGNALVGAWQEYQAGQAVAALQRIGTSTATVLRDRHPVTIPVGDIVPGDVLVLAPGERVAADARLIDASGLEVDEAAMTGESLPVAKSVDGPSAASRVLLAGSGVTVGTGRAVVVAVGSRTRLGATAAALALDETRSSPLGVKLNRMLRQILPLAGAGGLIVLAAGLLRGASLGMQMATAATVALASVPEGLPLLAGASEAAVARRLAARGALVRRLSAIEALGRVDVACADKTGTLTEGRLTLRVVAGMDSEVTLPASLPQGLRDVVLTAALASPHPKAPDANAHPTDIAVREGAESVGLGTQIQKARLAESSFDPVHPFHAAVADGKLRVKGATEALLARCTRVREGRRVRDLDPAGRQRLVQREDELAARGLRVLMVAEGSADLPPGDPSNLTALGFVGIADPLRPDVPDAVRRTREAGIRVIMLTGDHPATARAIAREAGLLRESDDILTGDTIAELDDAELDRFLERAAVIARVTPLDKLRIVESLQRQGHTVAMTGDGVNDAPALRLADVGVAMGRGGTEVARQAAAVVLADDDFATLVEALVEGRSFWRNIRRALGLLLGGNLGELGLMVGGSILGTAAPMISRQILAVNLVTDVMPSLAVALQPPETRHLAALAREGRAALDRPLRDDMIRRGILTAVPSLAAFLLSSRAGGIAEGRSVAFASVVATQLGQTLQAGWAEGALTRPVLGAVGGSTALLLASLTVPPLRAFLGLVIPSPLGWLLIGAASFAAMLASRGIAGVGIPLLRPAGTLPAAVAP